MQSRLAVCVLGVLVVGCSGTPETGNSGSSSGNPESETGGTGGATLAYGPDSPEPPLASSTYAATSDDIKNPERGFFYGYLRLTDDEGSYDWLNQAQDDLAGYTLAGAIVRLDVFRASDLPDAKIAEIARALARIRAAGLKVVLRFSYHEPGRPLPGDPQPDDEPAEAVVLRHIQQLAPLLKDYQDVIAVLQAGFIGLWGEWHHSTSGLTDNVDPFKATDAEDDILDAILTALPASRMVQLRYPAHKMAFYGDEPLGNAEAFSGTKAARIGHHNDCFLASDNDEYTYPEDPNLIASQKAYVAAETRFTPHGGETCGTDARTSCSAAVAEMTLLHTSNLNRGGNGGAVDSWRDQGCLGKIERRLGYRFELARASWSSAVKPGGLLALEVKLRNSGFGSLFNARPVFAVLDSGKTRWAAELTSVDARRWAAGADSKFAVNLRVPANAPAGTYRLSLWLPDAAEGLRANPAYSIRLANDGTWNADGALNVLTPSLRIDPAASGSRDASAPSFVEVR